MSTTRDMHEKFACEAGIHSKLTAAAANNNLAEVMQLFPKSDMRWQDPIYGNTALHWAIANSNITIAVYLAEHAEQSDINIQDSRKKTALHLAIGKGWAHVNTTNKTDLPQACVILFLVKKTNLAIQDAEGNTPLHIAVMRRDVECAKELLKNGARCDIQNNAKQTTIDMLTMDFTTLSDFINSYARSYTLSQKTWEQNRNEMQKLLKSYSLAQSSAEIKYPQEAKAAKQQHRLRG